MKIIKIIAIFLLLSSIIGCAARVLEGMNPSLFNNIEVGMTSEKTIAILGQPASKSVSHGAELLHYKCVEKGALGTDNYIDYGVLLRDNKVLAFGRHTSFANDPVRWKIPNK